MPSEEKTAIIGSKSTSETQPGATVKEYRNVSVTGLVLVGFFWVSGGIYGNEALIEAGPPATVFALLLASPFLYAGPLGLVCAELSTAMPVSGGVVVWVKEAFGHGWGFYNAYLIWIMYVVDACVYPVLAGDYTTSLGGGPFLRYLTGATIIFISTITQLKGSEATFWVNTVVTFCTLAPCFVFVAALVVYSAKNDLVTASVWLDNEGDTDWGLLLSWIMWLSSGFMSLGALAGEVTDPKRSFTITLAILLPLTTLLNIVPLAFCLWVEQDQDMYNPGFFADLAERIAGQWLSYAIVVGGNVCLLSLYNSQVMISSRSFVYILETWAPHVLPSQEEIEIEPRVTGRCSRALWDKRGAGIGRGHILIHSAISMLLIVLPYDVLIQFEMLLTVPCVTLLLLSFVHFKWKQPHMQRPFSVPGGVKGGCLIVLPPLVCTLINGWTIIEWSAHPAEDIDPRIPEFFQGTFVELKCTAILLAVGFIAQVAWWIYQRRYGRYDAISKSVDMGAELADDSLMR